jgi:hypothetical protein
MMRCRVLAMTAALCAGCTTDSLERQALLQIHSTVDYRYEAVLKCLAAVAQDPSDLPSFAILSDGTSRAQDTVLLSSITLWTRALNSFAAETLGVSATRSPQDAWTIDQVADYTQLEAMRCACQWVLYGPERALEDHPGLLNSPADDPTPGPHFGVAGRLTQMPKEWLHVGCLRDVPTCARYRCHVGSKWVWVLAEGMEGLSDFALVLHDIATLDINAGATTAPPLLVTLELREFVHVPKPFLPSDATSLALGSLGNAAAASLVGSPPAKVDWSPLNSHELVFPMTRVVKPEYKQLIQQKIANGIGGKATVHITLEEWLACTMPYYGPRISNTAVGPGPVEVAAAAAGAQVNAASAKTPFQIMPGPAPVPAFATPFQILPGSIPNLPK